MSAKQTGLVWELNLPQNEAWVLMAMADHADHEGNNVYPGVPRLAWKTGYTTRQVRRILAILRSKGLIVVEEQGGGRKATRYRLDLAGADRKGPLRPEYARSRRAASVQASEAREEKMSSLASAAPGAPMSPQPGQNVGAARTRLCHPNRQGREGKEPSIPPPAVSPHPWRPTAAGGNLGCETGEGGEKTGDHERGDGEAPLVSLSSEGIRRVAQTFTAPPAPPLEGAIPGQADPGRSRSSRRSRERSENGWPRSRRRAPSARPPGSGRSRYRKEQRPKGPMHRERQDRSGRESGARRTPASTGDGAGARPASAPPCERGGRVPPGPSLDRRPHRPNRTRSVHESDPRLAGLPRGSLAGLRALPGSGGILVRRSTPLRTCGLPSAHTLKPAFSEMSIPRTVSARPERIISLAVAPSSAGIGRVSQAGIVSRRMVR